MRRASVERSARGGPWRLTLSQSHSLFRIVPLVTVASLAIAISAQTGCTSKIAEVDPGDGGPTGGSCRAGELLRRVGSRNLCCKDASGGTQASCFEPGGSRPQDNCNVVGATTQAADDVKIAFDACVREECAGNRMTYSFAADSALSQSTLTCVSSTSGPAWQRTGVIATHHVTRACQATGTSTCTASYGSAYNPSPFTITVREVSVVSSTCTMSGGREMPCGVGDL